MSQSSSPRLGSTPARVLLLQWHRSKPYSDSLPQSLLVLSPQTENSFVSLIYVEILSLVHRDRAKFSDQVLEMEFNQLLRVLLFSLGVISLERRQQPDCLVQRRIKYPYPKSGFCYFIFFSDSISPSFFFLKSVMLGKRHCLFVLGVPQPVASMQFCFADVGGGASLLASCLRKGPYFGK